MPEAEPKKEGTVSILSTIETDFEKFFKGTETDLEKFGSAFKQLFLKSASAEQTVESFIQEVAPFIVEAVSLADPIAEPLVAGALATAETALAGIQAATTSALTGTSLLAGLENFNAQIPTLLTSLDIKDANLKAIVVRIANLITNECKVLIPAVQSWIAQIKASNPAQTAAA